MCCLKGDKDAPCATKLVGCFIYVREKGVLLVPSKSASYMGCWEIPTILVSLDVTESIIIDELCRATGILPLNVNIKLNKRFHINLENTVCQYDAYTCELSSMPVMKITFDDKQPCIWMKPEGIMEIRFVPFLINIMKDLMSILIDKHSYGNFIHTHETKTPVSLIEQNNLQPFFKFEEGVEYEKDKKWFASLGAPASGKSSGLRAMAEHTNSFCLSEDSILENNSRLTYLLDKIFICNDRKFLFNFQIEILGVRFWQTIRAQNLSLIDETIFSSLAYSRALYSLQWITEYEYESFCNNYISYLELLPKPTVVYYFFASEKTIQERIKHRSREHEQYYTDEYISALCNSFAEVAKELSNVINVVFIDTDKYSLQDIALLYTPHFH